MKIRSYQRTLSAACVAALAALGLMVWSLITPTPMPVLVAMSAGQALGTLSLLAFLGVVAADLRHAHLERELRSPGSDVPMSSDGPAPGPSKTRTLEE
jgi:hypothetical protein